MDAEQFLDRLVPPGNFHVVAYKKDPASHVFSHKYYRTAHDAAGYVLWASNKGMDTWHACASYAREETRVSQKDGSTYQVVPRTQDNVAELKAFWVDLDISRPGDGKDPSKVYATAADAIQWVGQFVTATGMPKPNLVVQSGYGMHLYWVLETAIDRPTWQPYAEALKAAVVATGGKADIVVTADSARILRTPGTWNYKVPASPAPVRTLLATPEFYPNAQVYAALQQYVGTTNTTVVTVLGAAPAHVGSSSLNAAANANLPVKRNDKSFAEIAKKCQQVKYSLDTHGEFDDRTIWYLGMLTLAYKTMDGADFVHSLSSGYKGYDPVVTDAQMAQIDMEQTKKDTGAPTCKFFQQYRPAQCQGCPFAGKVNTPWSLGARNGDLPENYRRRNGRIEKAKHVKDEILWDRVVDGDVYGPQLFVINDVHHITFTYDHAGRAVPITYSSLDNSTDIGFNVRLFNQQRMTLDTSNAVKFGDFAMAFLNHLKAQRLERDDVVKPYGWSTNENGEITGLAIAGQHYKEDGGTERVTGAMDREQAAFYRARGTITPWKTAASALIKNRPDVQLMMALAMAAPLMRFTAQPGLVTNFWSTSSGTGKSSAIKVAQNIWATQAAMTTMLDTDNAVCARVAEGQCVPLLWDEIRIDAENIRTKTNLVFSIAQGKDKTRMRADTSVRVGREWQTIMICTGNQPLLHLLGGANAATDANGMRIMDFVIDLEELPPNNSVAVLVQNSDRAAGTPGAILAAHYAKEHKAIEARIMKVQDFLTKEMKCQNSGERFYVAAMACAMVAADIAKKLDVLKLDASTVWAFAKKNWLQIRGEKKGDVTQNGKIDLLEVFGRFYTDHSNRHLVTNFFRTRGALRKGDKFSIMPPANQGLTIVMHSTQREKILRIDLTIFRAWLAKKGIPQGAMLAQMREQWGAIDDQRQVLGGGTTYSGGQKMALDLSLAHPDLLGYDQGDDPTDPYGATVVKRAPSQAVAGNQVAV